MHLENIVKETLEIKDHRIVSIEGDTKTLVVTIEAIHRRLLPCSGCGRRSKRYDRLGERFWRHVPIWGIPVQLVYRPVRIVCPVCGIRRERLPWAEGKQTITRQLSVTIAQWSKLLAIDLVALLFGVHWNTVYGAIRSAVAYGLAHRQISEELYLGIDELSRKKGHVYVTNVYDLRTKTLLWSGEGRTAETLTRFFQECPEAVRASIRGVCCDMWAPYEEVIRAQVPEAIVVFDKFHLLRHLLEAVDSTRKLEYRRLKNTEPELLKGTKYLFLKNPWNLTPHQRERLGYLEHLNLRTNRSYLLKEKFRRVWAYTSPAWAKKFLEHWCWQATHSRLKPMKKFVELVRRHMEGIVNWFRLPIDNGATEAMNNNAKAVSHRAHGYRTASTFITLLYLCLGGLPDHKLAHSFV